MIGLHDLAGERGRHGNRGLLRENLGQQTLVPGVEMLHDDIGHPGRRGKSAQKLGDGFEPSRRGSDADDRQACADPHANRPGEYRPRTVDRRQACCPSNERGKRLEPRAQDWVLLRSARAGSVVERPNEPKRPQRR